MVDLVKIRKKAKKAAAAEPPAPPADAVSTEPAAVEAAVPAEAAPVPAAEAVAPPAAAPAPALPPAPAAGTASASKLDRFREQAGRLRDAVAGGEAQAPLGEGVFEVLSFVIAGEHYAADIERIVEIVTPRAMTRVPNADPSILGIVSLRGMMVTIVDVRSRLRHRRQEVTPETRVIVVEHLGETIGFEVDRVLRVLKLERKTVETHPVVHASEADDSIVGVFRHEGALTILLDFDKLLASAAAVS